MRAASYAGLRPEAETAGLGGKQKIFEEKIFFLNPCVAQVQWYNRYKNAFFTLGRRETLDLAQGLWCGLLEETEAGPAPNDAVGARQVTRPHSAFAFSGGGGLDLRRCAGAQRFVRLCFEDLEFVSASPLRASGFITKDATSAIIRFGEVEFVVGVIHIRFPNGGDWARLVCPACGRPGRKLWLLDGEPRCLHCCLARGVGARAWPLHPLKRAEMSAARLFAKLSDPKPARLNPRPGRRLDRRRLLEVLLSQSRLVLRRNSLRREDE
jgi:hypothetical protein